MSFLSPTSYLGAPPFPLSQYLFPGVLVADSGPGSSHSDLNLDGSRAVPEVRIFLLSLGQVCLWGEWVSNVRHFLTLPCPPNLPAESFSLAKTHPTLVLRVPFLPLEPWNH